ncbi:p7 [Dregea volubilis virus 1]|nr:p7 [Dregea volubilis virus 1]
MDCSLRAYLLFLLGWGICFVTAILTYGAYKICRFYSASSQEVIRDARDLRSSRLTNAPSVGRALSTA